MRIFISLIAAILSTGCDNEQPKTPTSDKANGVSKRGSYNVQFTESEFLMLKGDLGAVKKHLAAGADVNALNQRGTTLLADAALMGHLNQVEFLLEKGADVNKVSKYNLSPLLKAAPRGHLEIVEKLIEKRANINHKGGTSKTTSLALAVENGRGKVVELLIEKGADLNISNYMGNTPLHIASKAELMKEVGEASIQIIELLIKSGAEINAKNDEGKTPLDVAATEIIAKLFRRHGSKTGEELGVQ